MLVNGDTRAAVIELPAQYVALSFGVVAPVVDRCATSSPALHAMMRCALFVALGLDPLR